jgi:predicted GTPase
VSTKEALAKLAGELSVESVRVRKVIDEVSRKAGEQDARMLSEALGRAAAHLKPAPVRLTVGGHFSSGKSSLVNMVIGNPLLPTDELPETGVPCLLRSGDANRVLVRTGSGVIEIPFATEAISRYVSLIGTDGDYRDDISAVQDVRVILASQPIPADATWVDSPGINDVTLREVAADLARQADILVWVVNSHQALALTEQEFLAAHLSEAGPAGVVFVINAFLESDTPQAWQTFTARRNRYESRIIQNVDTKAVSPRIVVASARAAAATPGEFGGPQARALFASLSDPAAPRVAATRLFRAHAELAKAVEELRARAADEERRVARAARAAVEREKARAREHSEFLRSLKREIASVFSRNSDLASDVADEVLAQTNGTLQSAGHYGALVEEKLTEALGEFAERLTRAVNQCAREHGHGTLGTWGANEIREVLQPDSITVSGTDPGSTAGGTVAGAAIGGTIGALFGGFGAIPGAAIGGAIGRAIGGSAATSRQRQAIQAQLAQVGAATTAWLLNTQDAVVKAAERHCTQDAPSVPPPDQTRLDMLRRVQQMVADDIQGLLARELRALQARAGG